MNRNEIDLLEPATKHVHSAPAASGQSPMSARWRNEPVHAGSVLTEYLVVMAGLLIVYTGIDIALEFIRQHNVNYNFVLELLL